jgi:hypothetical protein
MPEATPVRFSDHGTTSDALDSRRFGGRMIHD